LGSLAPATALLFPADPRGITRRPAPVPLRDRVHPLVRFTSSSEFVITLCPLDAALSSEHLPWSFSSPSRHKPSESTLVASSHLASVPPSAFLTLSTVCSSLVPRGFISPRSHVRDCLSKGFPRCQVDSTHRLVVPSCRLPVFSSSRVTPTVQSPPPRLQGVDPGSDPLRESRGFSPASHSIPS
jgi:hypothetical protein